MHKLSVSKKRKEDSNQNFRKHVHWRTEDCREHEQLDCWCWTDGADHHDHHDLHLHHHHDHDHLHHHHDHHHHHLHHHNDHHQAVFNCHIDFSCMVTTIHWFHAPENSSSSLIKVLNLVIIIITLIIINIIIFHHIVIKIIKITILRQREAQATRTCI